MPKTQAHLSFVGSSGAIYTVSTNGTRSAPGSKLVSYVLNWGDGGTNTAIINQSNLQINLSHQYSIDGNYNVTLTIKDSKGRSDTFAMGMIVRIDGPTPPSPDWPVTPTIIATDCSKDAVNAAIALANDGDVVGIPAGNCTWDNNINGIEKDFSLVGQGVSTNISINAGVGAFIYCFVSNPAKGNFRVGYMKLNANGQDAYIKVQLSGGLSTIPSGRMRVDHIHFNGPAGFTTAVRHENGIVYGVVDHCTIDQFGGLVWNHQCGLSGESLFGNMMAGVPTGFGTDTFVFYEDNVVTMHNQGSTLFLYDSTSGGGRPVVRYNNFYGPCELYNHWTRGSEICMTAGEFYRNIWNFRPGDPRPGDGMARFEAGTLLFFENAFLNCPDQPFIVFDDRRAGGYGGESAPSFLSCDGTHPWDGNFGDPSAPGWPCLGQIGRGWNTNTTLDNLALGVIKQPSSPNYVWGNGQQIGCATGGACTEMELVSPVPGAYIKKTPHPNGDVDYIENQGPPPGYTPYTYPHPRTLT